MSSSTEYNAIGSSQKTDCLDASNFLYTDGAFKFNQKNKTTLLMLIFCSG